MRVAQGVMCLGVRRGATQVRYSSTPQATWEERQAAAEASRKEKAFMKRIAQHRLQAPMSPQIELPAKQYASLDDALHDAKIIETARHLTDDNLFFRWKMLYAVTVATVGSYLIYVMIGYIQENRRMNAANLRAHIESERALLRQKDEP
eukprot:TRINITY_DN23875_c0_g1_i1.p1 TRINITY_DN23875_c0_g1~~TRINITY_DN23875_c0_g1_i1.p1  ORF type:complete len:149 (+),score=16.68 TRINITY_DN23875_c0_g1_i1:230-676(+)